MNTNDTDTRFELRPTPDKFERLKNKLLAIRVQQAGTKWEEPMRDAANRSRRHRVDYDRAVARFPSTV